MSSKETNWEVSSKLFKLPCFSSKSDEARIDRLSYEVQKLFGGSSMEACVLASNSFLSNTFHKLKVG